MRRNALGPIPIGPSFRFPPRSGRPFPHYLTYVIQLGNRVEEIEIYLHYASLPKGRSTSRCGCGTRRLYGETRCSSVQRRTVPKHHRTGKLVAARLRREAVAAGSICAIRLAQPLPLDAGGLGAIRLRACKTFFGSTALKKRYPRSSSGLKFIASKTTGLSNC